MSPELIKKLNFPPLESQSKLVATDCVKCSYVKLRFRNGF